MKHCQRCEVMIPPKAWHRNCSQDNVRLGLTPFDKASFCAARGRRGFVAGDPLVLVLIIYRRLITALSGPGDDMLDCRHNVFIL